MTERRLWGAVALLPLVAGVVLGAIHAGYGCNIEDSDTTLQLFGLELLGLPIAAATVGVMAGRRTWGPRGRGWAIVGALAGAFLSLTWGFVAFWTLFEALIDAACY